MNRSMKEFNSSTANSAGKRGSQVGDWLNKNRASISQGRNRHINTTTSQPNNLLSSDRENLLLGSVDELASTKYQVQQL